MNYGKELCERLKAIRKAVADANGIEYNPTECHHKGRCPGTCPVCDAEVEALNKALAQKKANGEEIVMPEADVEDLIDAGIDPHPNEITMGESHILIETSPVDEPCDIPEPESNEDNESIMLMGDMIPEFRKIDLKPKGKKD